MAVILVVEDEVFIREIAEMMLQDLGHRTLSASDVDEALVLLRSAEPIDAMFTDIYLKALVLGGCDLATQAVKLRPTLRVLYTTGNSITEKMRAMFIVGTSCLHKPYTPLQLQASVEHLLAIEMSAELSAREESRRNWQLTQSIVDTIRDPLVVLEHDMTIVTASKAFLTMFGITEAEAQGRRVSELGQHQWDVPALRHVMEKVLPENKPFENFEIEDDFPGLGRRVFNLNARKVFQSGDHTHRMLLVFEDITDRKQRERDALLLTNEISHRIKNNLQIVVGLIAYETKWTTGPCVQGYKAMQARIGAIAQLYDLISQSSRGRTIAVDAYLREIAKTMSASLLGNTSSIEIEVKADALEIDPDHAVPFGLLVNELATNAIKHAFPGGAGRVVLSVERIGDQLQLTVADNGIGMKDKDTAKAPEKRGSDYVDIFVRQLGGAISPVESDGPGTTISVRLPLIAVAAAA